MDKKHSNLMKSFLILVIIAVAIYAGMSFSGSEKLKGALVLETEMEDLDASLDDCIALKELYMTNTLTSAVGAYDALVDSMYEGDDPGLHDFQVDCVDMYSDLYCPVPEEGLELEMGPYSDDYWGEDNYYYFDEDYYSYRDPDCNNGYDNDGDDGIDVYGACLEHPIDTDNDGSADTSGDWGCGEISDIWYAEYVIDDDYTVADCEVYCDGDYYPADDDCDDEESMEDGSDPYSWPDDKEFVSAVLGDDGWIVTYIDYDPSYYDTCGYEWYFANPTFLECLELTIFLDDGTEVLSAMLEAEEYHSSNATACASRYPYSWFNYFSEGSSPSNSECRHFLQVASELDEEEYYTEEELDIMNNCTDYYPELYSYVENWWLTEVDEETCTAYKALLDAETLSDSIDDGDSDIITNILCAKHYSCLWWDVDDADCDNDYDGVLLADDSDDFDSCVCSDDDDDDCDDCSTNGCEQDEEYGWGNETYDPANDGPDFDGDGLCDAGDDDDDDDGIADADGDTCLGDDADTDEDGVCDDEDEDINDPTICFDSDNDSCDDCSSGSYDPANDGDDEDEDGICDDGEENASGI